MSVFPANATLTFQVSTGEKEIDELGNVRTIVQPLVVQAYLKEGRGRRQPTETDRASEANVIGVSGRCVEPSSLPPTLLPGAKAKAVIGGIEGEFYLEACLQSAYAAVTDVLGAKLKGSFEARVTYGERG
jgi:hypothetical protein